MRRKSETARQRGAPGGAWPQGLSAVRAGQRRRAAGAGAPERETPRAGPGRFGVRRVRDGGAAAQNSKAAAFSNPSSTGAAASKARQEETPEAVRVNTSQRP